MSDRPDPLAEPDWYGKGTGYSELVPVPPAERTGTFVPLMDAVYAKPDTLCAAGRQNPESEPACKAERKYILIFGDVHEHIAPIDLCAAHAVDVLRRLAAGQKSQCGRCFQLMRLEKIEDTEGNEVKAGDIKAPVSSDMQKFIQDKLDLL